MAGFRLVPFLWSLLFYGYDFGKWSFCCSLKPHGHQLTNLLYTLCEMEDNSSQQLWKKCISFQCFKTIYQRAGMHLNKYSAGKLNKAGCYTMCGAQNSTIVFINKKPYCQLIHRQRAFSQDIPIKIRQGLGRHFFEWVNHLCHPQAPHGIWPVEWLPFWACQNTVGKRFFFFFVLQVSLCELPGNTSPLDSISQLGHSSEAHCPD